MGYGPDFQLFATTKTFHPDLILKLAAKLHLFFDICYMLKKIFNLFTNSTFNIFFLFKRTYHNPFLVK